MMVRVHVHKLCGSIDQAGGITIRSSQYGTARCLEIRSLALPRFIAGSHVISCVQVSSISCSEILRLLSTAIATTQNVFSSSTPTNISAISGVGKLSGHLA